MWISFQWRRLLVIFLSWHHLYVEVKKSRKKESIIEECDEFAQPSELWCDFQWFFFPTQQNFYEVKPFSSSHSFTCSHTSFASFKFCKFLEYSWFLKFSLNTLSRAHCKYYQFIEGLHFEFYLLLYFALQKLKMKKVELC